MVTDHKKKPQEKKEHRELGFETISERVRRHLRDIKSQITDEDVRNVRIELKVENKTIYDIFQR
ncbi:MAG TPA: hypothetical protein VGQ09_12750 [Chitinophagaceae bacterium]|jgi:hypothetical protein|nr:hypothetical protein [Chitinophagaceae bacterium]